MSETREEVVAIRVDLVCDKCGIGKMRHHPSDGALCSSPPQYPHTCNNKECRYHIYMGLRHIYPYIEYVPKEKP